MPFSYFMAFSNIGSCRIKYSSGSITFLGSLLPALMLYCSSTVADTFALKALLILEMDWLKLSSLILSMSARYSAFCLFPLVAL